MNDLRTILKNDINNRKRGILYFTKKINEAAFFCDKIGILLSGKIILLNNVKRLKERYGSGYILKIITKDNELNVGVDDLVKTYFQDAILIEW